MNQAQEKILRADFEEWWSGCWLKVGKLAAEKEYYKARRLASREKLLEGRDQYRETKPLERAWCHPVTWFRQGRWLDEPEPRQLTKAEADNLRRVLPNYEGKAEIPKRVAGSLQKWWDD